MDYFFISGAPNTGKTGLVTNITRALIETGYTDITNRFQTPDENGDFRCILQGFNNHNIQKTILINTPSDNPVLINGLIQFYREYPSVDIIITSIRDGIDPMRGTLLNQLQINRELDFQLELPLAKILRRNQFDESLTWYQNTLLNIAMHILRRDPFNL